MIFCGTVQGDLTVLSKFRSKSGHVYCKCKCRCGNEKDIREIHIEAKKSTSCGLCGYKEKYPFAHKSWDSMNQRCNNPNSPDYPNYGGRGIKVCLRWLRFIDFFDDMGNPPTDSITGNRFTLDRIDNNGDYTPENCKWSSHTEQSNNKRNNISTALLELRKKGNHYRTVNFKDK